MKRVIVYLFFGVLFIDINSCYSQTLQDFHQLLGTAKNDNFSSILTLTNGDYIVSGTTTGISSGSDIYVARVTSQGVIVWQYIYGGFRDENNCVSTINNNGNIIIAGSSSSYNAGADSDIFVFEINTNGLLQWARTYIGKPGLDDIPQKIVLSPHGLLLCATIGPPGSNSPDILVLEITNNGALVNWQNQIGISAGYGDIPSSIIPSKFGGYLMVGGSFTNDRGYDQVIWKLDKLGKLVATIAYGSVDNENAQDLIELPNDDIVIMGNFRVLSGSGLEFSLVSIKPNGKFNWIKTYGDNSIRDERAYGFVRMSNGGYAFCGYTNGLSMGTNNDILLVRTNSVGNLIGTSTFGSNGNETSSCIVQNSDESFTIAGISNSNGSGLDDGYLIRTDKNGNVSNSCSSYKIIERNLSLIAQSYGYKESSPQLSSSLINITRLSTSFIRNDFLCSTLPVQLVSFYCEKTEQGNCLTWSTSFEQNSSHYDIEISEDGENWKYLNSCKSKGISSEVSYYSYVDKEVLNGLVYYRLKQIDFDGHFYYSKIIKVNSTTNSISISPNPTHQKVYVKTNLSKELSSVVTVKNMTGLILYQNSYIYSELNEGIYIDLINYDAGLYIITISNEADALVAKIVKE